MAPKDSKETKQSTNSNKNGNAFYIIFSICALAGGIFVTLMQTHEINKLLQRLDTQDSQNILILKPQNETTLTESQIVQNETEETTMEVKEVEVKEKKPIYWSYCNDTAEKSMYNIRRVLQRTGFEKGEQSSDWDLLWAFHYAFIPIDKYLKDLKPHQLVNQVPGTNFITNKLSLSLTPSKFIPKAFNLPGTKEKFYEYAKENPKSKFVQKNIQHRGISIKDVNEIDMNNTNIFIQEFVQRPYLIDGYKFDIGVYTIITSVDPLRVYFYKGDMMFRFCMKEYYPLNTEDRDKYVVEDQHKSPEDLPSLARLVTELGYSPKHAVEHYIRKQGQDPSIIWKQMEEFTYDLFEFKMPQIMTALKGYKSPSNFFQLMRIDIVLDEDLNVYVMEANLSPNLSSGYYPKKRLTFDQVLFNTLALVGAGRYVHTASFKNEDTEIEEMRVADRNIMVAAEHCESEKCKMMCDDECAICKLCLLPKHRDTFAKAYLEHVNKRDCQRVFPPSMEKKANLKSPKLEKWSKADQMMHMWFQAKCNEDATFCV